ncbi:putative kinetochore protein mis14 protein [Venturia nashicola]|nr:putative kinetochore protein mis14 protein [Venturia nashicola]
MANLEDGSRAHQNNTFRKIELQSAADLRHLQTLSQRAARQKINVAFPPTAQEGGEDGLRKRVEGLVGGYVEEVFCGVRSNILVNGVEVGGDGDGEGGGREVSEEFEALDTRLAERIRVLEEQKEKLTEKVADLRRVGPEKAAKLFRERWAVEEAVFETQMETGAGTDGQDGKGEIDLVELKRWDDVQGTWEKGTEGLVKLKTDLTETVARLERAKGVVEYLGEKR